MQKNESFIHSPNFATLLLLFAAIVGFVLANIPASQMYLDLHAVPLAVSVGNWSLEKSALHFVNDGLMAIFFLMVGLELKKEVLVGSLADPRKAALAVFVALGGMLVPALIYAMFNMSDPSKISGWGVPMATDIAFALALISSLGNRVPASLKALLMAAAIIDDLGAILVIAFFYTSGLKLMYLAVAAGIFALLYGLNVKGVQRKAPYLLLGVLLWYCFLKSGVHATVSGVLLAFAIPLRGSRLNDDLTHALHTPVALLILPIFAFMNTGVTISGGGELFGSVAIGVLLGLAIGKPIGATFLAWIAVKAGVSKLPEGVRWAHIGGMGAVMGIGFTMALFIAGLAFDSEVYLNQAKIGLLIASLSSAVAGFLLLRGIKPATSALAD